MQSFIRFILFVTALGLLVIQVGFVTKAPWATQLWPWPDTPLTYLFVGSIFAAVALPIAWVGLSGELAALRGGALDFTVSYLGISSFLLWFYQQNGVDPINPYTLFVCGGVLLNFIIYLLSRRVEFADERPMPGLVRWSFLLFALVLMGVGSSLIMLLPHIFPWPLKPETSVLIGFIFLGAAVYFLYGFFVPLWSNACGQLLGFLAYDAVLLGPFIKHFDKVKEEHLLSLTIYVGVLIYSALLAIYFLFLHPATRLSRAR